MTYYLKLLLWILFTSVIGGVEQNFCAKRLGLENGGISDNQIQASENTTSASGGRLNNLNSAWCFHNDDFIGQKAYFLVDLGSVQLISGFLSQGPPHITSSKRIFEIRWPRN